MKKKKKHVKYCEVHKFEYMEFLDRCPICVGEILGKMNKLGLPTTVLKTAIRKNKIK